ncbi:MAG: Lrp/AsnC family transcriptional regulator [Gammaproteobacteria bacterium]|nr:Lrp/AsnC family transcriptional regulator [Gammaproteobacteria bacterium]MDH3378678.1 Lrp/AsnC family transcriptional regulator [Gammaproteobacteria bacterium]
MKSTTVKALPLTCNPMSARGTRTTPCPADEAEPHAEYDGNLSALARKLINEYQRDFPVTVSPFAEVAQQLGVTEAETLDTLRALQESGIISRIGPVFKPKKLGDSTLATMAVPPERLEEIAALVNQYVEVNHNYERENRFNLWFVVTAPSTEAVRGVLADIQSKTGLEVVDLPLEQEYHIDLGFPLWS